MPNTPAERAEGLIKGERTNDVVCTTPVYTVYVHPFMLHCSNFTHVYTDQTELQNRDPGPGDC